MLRPEPALTQATRREALIRRIMVSLFVALAWLGLGATWVVLYDAGVGARAWLWEQSAPVRFTGDIRNGMNWGGQLLRTAHRQSDVPFRASGELTWRQFFGGYVTFYDAVADRAGARHHPDGRVTPQFGLDYTPLRLLTMSAWMHGVRQADPEVRDGRHWRDELAAPLLRFNLWHEAAAAALMLGLVWTWVAAGGRSHLLAAWLGTLAGGLVWFNPAVLLDAHAWPQWDVWCLPYYLGACWAASGAILAGQRGVGLVGWWIAGLLVGIGAMFKGQILIAAGVLPLWALFSGQWRGVPAFVGGLVGAAALVVWPWTVPGSVVVGPKGASVNPMAGGWIVATAACAAVLPLLCRTWGRRGVALAFIGAITLWAVAMEIDAGALPARVVAVVLPGLLAAVAVLVPLLGGGAWARVLAVASLAAGATVAGGWVLGGSLSWLEVGFLFPTGNHAQMVMGPVSNLPAVLAGGWGWGLRDSVAMPESAARWVGESVGLRALLATAYVFLLFGCGAAAAWQSRRRDVRVLAAVAAPWVLFFALLPQMHERYLVWGAVVSAGLAAVSLGGLLAHLAITLIAAAMIGNAMLHQNRDWWPEMLRVLDGARPGLGWAMLVLAVTVLVLALGHGGRWQRIPAGTGRIPGADGTG